MCAFPAGNSSSRHQLSNRQLGQVHATPRGNEAAVPGTVGAIIWRHTADHHHRRAGNRIGEMNNIVFLTQLTHLWRSELCRYAKSMEPFVLPNHTDTYQPAQMTSARWQVVILVLWSNLKADLNVVDEMVYLQGLAARGIELPKAFGHKPKQKAQPDVKAPRDNRNKPAVPRKGKPQVTQETPCASQIFLIITGSINKLPVKYPAGIPITTASLRG